MWGTGATQSGSIKKKLNKRSIMEAEIVGVENMASKILWKILFIEDQVYNVENNILHQDNKSSVLLDTNGRKSAGMRIWAMNIFYFFIIDQVEKVNVEIEHCPNDGMVDDL